MSLASGSQDNILRYTLVTCLSESTIPTIVQSVGVSSRLKGKLASLPRHQKTNSPTPAPAASTATRGFPCGNRSLLRDWTISSLRPSREGFFTVATTVPITRASCISQVQDPRSAIKPASDFGFRLWTNRLHPPCRSRRLPRHRPANLSCFAPDGRSIRRRLTRARENRPRPYQRRRH